MTLPRRKRQTIPLFYLEKLPYACRAVCDSAYQEAENYENFPNICKPDSAYQINYSSCQLCSSINHPDSAGLLDTDVALQEIFGSYTKRCNNYQRSLPATKTSSGFLTIPVSETTERASPSYFPSTVLFIANPLPSNITIIPDTTNFNSSSNGTIFNDSNSPHSGSGFDLRHKIATGIGSGAAALLIAYLVFRCRHRTRSQGQSLKGLVEKKEQDLENYLESQSIVVDFDVTSIRDTITLAGTDDGSLIEMDGSPAPITEMDVESGACELDLNSGYGEMDVGTVIRAELSVESGYGELKGSHDIQDVRGIEPGASGTVAEGSISQDLQSKGS
ncbi:hypothetical protein QBC36DRAFT_287602 [Triangularia setosa]|uniref:Uncharacterized protein n=1 Tax=Triangularia setosa TaxID=2587417 RepID=A0AAN6WD39_9PEZI|nr:hypothetical protein QBC36DRAFT_287602 [Podospora setosa]